MTELAVLDFETTGLVPGQDEVLQVAVVDETGAVLMNEYCRPTASHGVGRRAEGERHRTAGRVRQISLRGACAAPAGDLIRRAAGGGL